MNWEKEVAVSQDCATALQPGDRARLCLKKKNPEKTSVAGASAHAQMPARESRLGMLA